MRPYWLALVALTACSGSEAPEAPPAEPAAVTEPAKEEPKPAEAPPAAASKVFFVEPAEGAKVKSPVKVVFGVEGMTVQPAGEVVENHGHHHVIVDGGPIPKGEVVPADATHIHFGKGQTETTVELPPGEHTLTMQFADGQHMSYGPDMSATVKITVE